MDEVVTGPWESSLRSATPPSYASSSPFLSIMFASDSEGEEVGVGRERIPMGRRVHL